MNKYLRKFLILALIVFTSLLFTNKVEASESIDEPSQQFRAVWLSHYINDFPKYTSESQYKSDFLKVLDNLEKLHINTILFHMRTHNNALYESELNPLASYYKGVDFNKFDPITWMIEECHKRQIEFHAWLNPYRVSNSTGYDLDQIVESYKDYPFNPASSASNLLFNTSSVILNPALPNVRSFICDTVEEIMNQYDIDGIHFDDYFYINKIDDSEAIKKYNTKGLSADDFRREQVNILIKSLHNVITNYNIEKGKAVQFGIAPSTSYKYINYEYQADPVYNENGDLISPEGAYSNVLTTGHYDGSTLCDTKKWIDEGWIDYILPQVYAGIGFDKYNYQNLSTWWSQVVKYKETNLYIGVGSANANSLSNGWSNTTELKDILSFYNNNEKILGTSYFNYSSLVNTTSNMEQFRKTNNEVYKTKVPSVKINFSVGVNIPSNIISNIKVNTLENTITWDKVENVRGYLVWKVPQNKILDTTKAEYILSYQSGNIISEKINPDYKYYISNVNYANEISTPVLVNESNEIINIESYINDIELNESFSIDYERNINLIFDLYDSLDEASKQKISNSNKDKLLKAYNRVCDYNNMKKVFEQYLSNLDRDIKYANFINEIKNYKINYIDNEYITFNPLQIKLSSYGSYFVPLTITINNEYDTISRTYYFNIGELTSETGRYLYYRNASGAVFAKDPQDYTGSFIGESEYALLYENHCMFLAKGNYFEITSSTIKNIPYTSCGGIYKNITDKPITIETSGLVGTNDLGFLLAENNEIVMAREKLALVQEITIKPNSFLYICKYLDTKINNSPFKTINETFEGKYLNVVKYNDYKEAAKIEDLMIKSFHTLDYNKVNDVYMKYNELSENDKKLVFSSQKFIDYYRELKMAYEALNAIIDYANMELNGLDLKQYNIETQAEITNLIIYYLNLINKATTMEEVTKLLDDYEKELASFPTIEEEYNQKKKEIIEKVEDIESSHHYITDKAINRFNELITTAYEDIEKSQTINSLDELYSNLLTEIAKINDEKMKYDLSSISVSLNEYVYDGKPHTITLSNLPEGLTPKYIGDYEFINNGKYEIKFEFLYDSVNYLDPGFLSFELIIHKAKYDISDLSFENKIVTYDGKIYSIEVNNSPDGVEVSYSQNSFINAGEYKIIASFKGSDNYEEINDMTAILTINKKDFDLSMISFKSQTFEYDKKEHVLLINGDLPEGIEVTYKDNTLTEPGEKKAICMFTVNQNYNDIENLEATIKVVKENGCNSLVSLFKIISLLGLVLIIRKKRI